MSATCFGCSPSRERRIRWAEARELDRLTGRRPRPAAPIDPDADLWADMGMDLGMAEREARGSR